MSDEFVNSITKDIRSHMDILNEMIGHVLDYIRSLGEMEKREELTIPYIKRIEERCLSSIKEQESSVKRIRTLLELYGEQIEMKNQGIADSFFDSERKFYSTVKTTKKKLREYESFVPKNSDELKSAARKLLSKKGFVPDSAFEGDYATWIGVYARPKDKPTYLDPADHEEAKEQQKYSENGMKRDFSEWFDWEIVKGQLVEKD